MIGMRNVGLEYYHAIYPVRGCALKLDVSYGAKQRRQNRAGAVRRITLP
jgi:hypothetical protein